MTNMIVVTSGMTVVMCHYERKQNDNYDITTNILIN